jgi:hypothetical protein
LEVDNLNFKQLHNINEVERALFQGWTIELLDVSFVELFKSEKALTIVMPPKICIIGNWIKCCMCGDYYLVNKWTHSNKYVMPLSILFFWCPSNEAHYGDPLWDVTLYYFPRVHMFECIPLQTFERISQYFYILC